MSDYEWVKSSSEVFRRMSENAEKGEQESKQDKEHGKMYSLAMEQYFKGKKQAYAIAADHLDSMLDIMVCIDQYHYEENVVITEEEQ